MTALKQRRTRTTVIALVAAAVGFVASAVIGIAGVRSLADSTAGELAAGQAQAAQTQRLPFTSTALVGVVDDSGSLTSAAAWVLEPNGVGGSIIGIAASADADSGTRDVLSPLAAVYDVSGASELRSAVERLTRLSFDVIEIVDQRRFAQLVSPLGDLPASFPVTVVDQSGEEWEAGESTLTSPAAARAITASDPNVSDWVFESARSAVWRAVAERIGAGVGSVTPIASDRDVPIPRNLDEFADRLYAAPVEFRALGFTPIDPDRVSDQLGQEYVSVLGPAAAVVAHDRAEVIIVFGAIAPSRLGAPLDAPIFRVVAPFTADDLADLGLNRADVLKRAIDRLFFAQANVVSVADISDEEVPDITRVLVADPTIVAAVREVYEPLFGEIEVAPAAVKIDGVDVEVTLGRSFLEELRGDSSPVVAGSGSNDDTGTNDEPTTSTADS
ncbi:MAG: hypothetical protein ABIP17_08345 [Ilumatobacteraceae bacterium]